MRNKRKVRVSKIDVEFHRLVGERFEKKYPLGFQKNMGTVLQTHLNVIERFMCAEAFLDFQVYLFGYVEETVFSAYEEGILDGAMLMSKSNNRACSACIKELCSAVMS